MKILQYLTIVTCLLFGSCQNQERSNRLYEEGISLELAQLRKQEIKDLKYHLSFFIPEKKQELVNGEMKASFTLCKPQEIILDFRESADKIQEVYVNGKSVEYIFQNEHIILPKASTIS